MSSKTATAFSNSLTLVQASLLKIMEAVGVSAPLDVTASYLWKTATTVTLDEMRRARWRHERSLDDVVSFLDHCAACPD